MGENLDSKWTIGEVYFEVDGVKHSVSCDCVELDSRNFTDEDFDTTLSSRLTNAGSIEFTMDVKTWKGYKSWLYVFFGIRLKDLPIRHRIVVVYSFIIEKIKYKLHKR